MIILVAAVLTYLSTGPVRSILVRTGQIAEIRERDVHTQPTPSLGGLAMFTGFMSAVFLAMQLPALTRGFAPVTPEMTAVVAGAFIIVVVGAIDDMFELDALTKFAGQVLAALAMSLLGLSFSQFYVPFGGGTTLILDPVQSVIVSTIFIVALVNAFNFVDGIDGLAAGLGLIAGASVLIYALTVLHDQGGTVSAYPPAIICAALVGMCGGFLPHNFEPARIFMGDSGAMLIGLLLAAVSISASGKINLSLYGAADVVALMSPVIVVLAAIALPVIDLVMAVIRRVAAGQSPFSADRKHIHHRLLALGHTHRRTVLVLYMWVSAFAFGAVSYSVFPAVVATGILVSLIVIAAVATTIPLMEGKIGPVGEDLDDAAELADHGRGTG
nr:MraY family glycosyltransferase [Corynebacterium aquatimens]